jgi:hypothetical protein
MPDADVVAREALLAAAAVLRLEAGVVGERADAVPLQPLGDALGRGARAAVDDARAGAQLQVGDELVVGALLRADGVEEVRPVERAAEVGRVLEAELGEDVGLDPLGRRGGERGQRDAGK